MTLFLAQENARRTLLTSITTVRDLGAQNETDLAMRDLINMHAIVGPRMFVAGQGFTQRQDGTADPVGPLNDYIQRNFESTRRAAKAGGRLGMGSDAVFTMFGTRASCDGG